MAHDTVNGIIGGHGWMARVLTLASLQEVARQESSQRVVRAMPNAAGNSGVSISPGMSVRRSPRLVVGSYRHCWSATARLVRHPFSGEETITVREQLAEISLISERR